MNCFGSTIYHGSEPVNSNTTNYRVYVYQYQSHYKVPIPWSNKARRAGERIAYSGFITP